MGIEMPVIIRLRPSLLLALAAACGCSTTYPRGEPVGKTFPSVKGSSLAGKDISIPAGLAGKPALLFIGYEQMTQFDIDRWLLALQASGVSVPVYELPTIPGLVPGLFAGRIDEGMRSGIPPEDWASVVTLYGDAPKVAEFLGNDVRLPARVVLLDAAGKVVFFHDRGFSPGALTRLRSAMEGVR